MARIAQIAYHTSPLAALGGRSSGGLNVYVLELSRELASLGYQVDMFTRNEGDGPAIESVAPNLRLVRVDAGPATPLEKEDQVSHIGEFVTNLVDFAAREQLGYQVIHSHYWQGARAGVQAARRLHAPHAVMFHTLGEVKNRARISEQEPLLRIRHERAAVRRADAIITGSDHESAFLERYYGADPAKLHTIPCGVDLELFHPRDQSAAKRELGLGLGPGRPVLLWVGRLEKLKGVDILIGALAQLEEPGATLLIVGGAEHAKDLKAELLAQAAVAGISDQVRFVGPVPHERLATYYNAADVCVVPSYYESFGLVAIEAMACGTPVVASRVGGLVSTVTDGVNGFLIPWRCPEPFAEKLDVLLHNPGLCANFGRSARRSVERFRWRSIALQVTGVYDAISKSYRSRSTVDGEGFGKEVYEAAVLAGRTP
jgi:D-inositol-3-phosphate glycosyltransferase